jgi:hypothetical protein
MKKLLKSLVVAGLVASAGSVMAATVDGSLVTGTTATSTGSQGSFDINVTKEDSVQISGLNSIVITQAGVATVPVTASDSVCYYATTNNYTVRMDSSSPLTEAGDIRLASGTNPMSYMLTWTETTGDAQTASWGAAAGGSLNDNVATASLTSDNKTSANCGGASNATIAVTIPTAVFNAAPTGLYTDTVNITIVGI